jgi:hypothetical protein
VFGRWPFRYPRPKHKAALTGFMRVGGEAGRNYEAF